MAQVQNQYTGDGSTVLFSFTFPYIETSDIKVSLDDTPTTEYTLANATTVEFNVAPADGAAIRIFRQTDSDDLKATFFPGSAIRAQDLNDNFEQSLYVAQETFLNSETADGAARQALAAAEAAEASAAQAETDAAAAVSTANLAASQVSGAVSDAAAAVAAANTASADAATAISTANNAESVALGIESKADQAIATANSAETTANSADSKADSALSSANSASSNAASAVSTANSANTKATQAASTASSANSTANSAESKADQALATANAADTAASSAASTASSAQTTANSAASTANEAKTTADGIEGKADSAIAVANSASIQASNAEGVAASADIKATNALSTASDAETTADAAFSIATGIDGKADQAIATAENAEDIAQDALDAVSGSSPWIGNATSVRLADQSKNVGIGEDNPAEKLHVDGISRFDGDVRVHPFTGSSEGGDIKVYNPDGATVGATLDVSTANSLRLFQIEDDSTMTLGQLSGTGGTVRVLTEGTERMRVSPDGRVGVGTDNPLQLIEVRGDDQPQIKVTATNTGTNSPGLFFENQGQRNWQMWADRGSDQFRIGNNFRANSNIVLSSGGDAGIGTTSPTARLTVNNDTATGAVNLADFSSTTAGANGLVRIINRNAANTGTTSVDFYKQYQSGFRINNNDTASSNFTAFNVGSSERMRLTADGNMGIGTSNPQEKLEVIGSIQLDAQSAGLKIKSGTVGTRGAVDFTFNTDNTVFGSLELDYETRSSDGLKLKSSSYPITVEYDDGKYFRIKDSSSERLRIDSSGNVGVGTSSPSRKLEVAGHLGVVGGGNVYLQNGARVQYGTSNATSVIGQDGSNGYLLFGVGNEVARFTSNGNFGIGTSNPNNLLDVQGASNPQIKVSATNTGTNSAGLYIENQGQRNWQIWADRASDQFRIGSTSRATTNLAITSAGNLGIGESSPTEKLDVNGNLRVRGNLIVDGTGGGGGGGTAETGYTNVKADFGAVGNGTADDTAAINNALQAGGAVYFPAGTYRVTSQITVTNKALHLYGDGQATRILFDPGSSGANFLDLRYNDGTPSPSQAYAISNLVIHAKQNKVCGFGVRLYFTGSATLVGVCNKLTLTNVDIGSEFASDANTGYFKIALSMLNSAGVVGTNLNIYTNSKTKVEYGVTDSVGIDIENSMAGHAMIRTLYLNNFYIQRYHTGIRAYSSAGNSYNSLESLYLSQGELLASKALRMERMAAITVMGIHSDVRDYFFDSSNSYGDIHYASTVRILGNDIRANRIDGEDVTTSEYLFKIKGQQTVISGNNIMSFKTTQGVIQTGGSNSNQINTVITGNHFSGNGSAAFKVLNTASGSREVRFGGNTLESFGGNLNPISNAVGSQLVVYGQRTGNTV